MKPIFIEGTNYTPKVGLDTNGQINIEGKSLPEDTAKFYDPILKWITECDIEHLDISIRLEYMNSSSAHQISKFLMIAKDNPAIKSCDVNWYYESNDEDSLDFGKELEYITDFKFTFHEYAEA